MGMKRLSLGLGWPGIRLPHRVLAIFLALGCWTVAICGQEVCSELASIQDLLVDQENEAAGFLIQPCLDRAIKRDGSPEHLAEIWRTASWWAVQSGRQAQALSFAEKAVALFSEFDDPGEKARVLQELGNSHFYLGHYDRAEDSFRYARSFAKESADHDLYQTVIKDLGVTLGSQGAFDEAIGMLRLVDNKSHDAKSSALAVSVLGNLSGYYRRLGFRELAYDSLQEALSVAQTRGVDHEIADIMLRIGHLWWRAGEVEQARDAFSVALRHSHRSGFGSQSWLLNSARDAELELDRFPEALAYARQALEYSSSIGNRQQMVYDLLGLADVLLESGDLSGESYLQQIESMEVVLDPGDRMWLRKLRADGERVRGDHDAEVAYLDQALSDLRLTITDRVKAGAISVAERESYDPIYRRAVEALTRRSRPEDWERAFSLVSESREFARGRESTGRQDQLTLRSDRSEDAHYQKLWKQRQSLRREMEKVESFPLERFQDLVDLEIEIAGHEKIMESGLPSAFNPEPLRLEKTLKRLGPQTVLLNFFRTEVFWVVWVLTEDGLKGRILPGDPEEIDGRVEGLRKLFEKGSREGWRPVAGRLYGDLVEPILGDFAGRRQVIVVPDGPLVGFPFETLLAPDGSSQEHLVERWAISYAPSARVWLERAPGVEDRIEEKILSYGYSPPARESGVGQGRQLRFNLYREVGRPLGPLPGVREELELIRQLSPQSVVVENLKATESHFRTLDHSKFTLMHFAGHALVGETAADQSALVLAPERKGALEDGFLRAPEIRHLKVEAELVVLSACKTLLGPERQSTGLTGLSDAFLSAGAHSVLATAWEVEDRAALLFMRRLYHYLSRGYSKAEALRRAKVDSIEEGLSPTLWAPFILVGDGDATLNLKAPRNPPAPWWMWSLGLSLSVFGLTLLGINDWRQRSPLATRKFKPGGI